MGERRSGSRFLRFMGWIPEGDDGAGLPSSRRARMVAVMAMIPAGNWAFRDTAAHARLGHFGLGDPRVRHIWSVSGCINGFSNANDGNDWVNQWRHNGHWHFNRVSDLRTAFTGAGVTGSLVPVFYEIHDRAYNEKAGEWIDLWCEDSFATAVEVPERREFMGFDVVSFSARTNPECSLFSCNAMSEEVDINEYCLCTWDIGRMMSYVGGLKEGDAEPGPYKIYGVYALPEVPRLVFGADGA